MDEIRSVQDLKDAVLSCLYNCDDIEKAVGEVIEISGNYLNVSRVYIFENSEDDLCCSNTFEWCNEGIEAEIQNLQNLRYKEDIGGDYQDNFNEHGLFFCPDITKLPKRQYDILAPQGIKAMLQCAILENKVFKGYIGFDDCNQANRNWNEEPEKVEILIYIARLLSIFLLERRNMLRIANNSEKLQTALNEANAANIAKNEFLSRVSHDMRTPMNATLSFSRMALEERPGYNVLMEYMQHIYDEGSYLLQLINDVLDFQKMESGNIELHVQAVDEAHLLNVVIEQIRNLALERNIEFAVDIKGVFDDALALIDPIRLQQVLVNLLGNAVKFTQPGGKIEFIFENMSLNNGVAHDKIVIRDNGIGMSETFMKTMYDPFTQEDTTIRSKTEGTGLGLSIVHKIVKLMNGTICCNSHVNEGTEFVLEFDTPMLLRGDSKVVEEKVVTTENEKILFGRRILLCEDHKVNALIAEKLLRKHGIQVQLAEDGSEGLALFEKSEVGFFDAILMDIRMPIMDGLETTRAIRRLSRSDGQTIPIIAMTANAFEEDIEASRVAGMNAHLSKPIDPEQLYQTLCQYIDNQKPIIKSQILVVDDVEVNLAVLEEALREDYAILLAHSGEEALEVLEQNTDVIAVITDIQMPKMNGVEFIKAVRSKEEYNRLAIIANTQYGDMDQEEMLLTIGADDFIYKPTTATIIKTRLGNVLSKRS